MDYITNVNHYIFNYFIPLILILLVFYICFQVFLKIWKSVKLKVKKKKKKIINGRATSNKWFLEDDIERSVKKHVEALEKEASLKSEYRKKGFS